MPRQINSQILIVELQKKIKKFYPYFLGFYLLCLLVAGLSKTWREFFYWPALHGSLLVFTLLFIWTFKIEGKVERGLGLNQAIKNIARLTAAASATYIIFIAAPLAKISRRSWLKIIAIALILVLALLKNIGAWEFLTLAYALISVIFILDSRWAAGTALVLLVICPICLFFKKDLWAEDLAVFAYYFLVITVATQVRELVRDKQIAE